MTDWGKRTRDHQEPDYDEFGREKRFREDNGHKRTDQQQRWGQDHHRGDYRGDYRSDRYERGKSRILIKIKNEFVL